ncbi:MAG: ribosome maturation factor RimM [bacterium]
MANNDLIIVGEIIKPHGVKGELVVEPLTDFPVQRFGAGSILQTENSDEFSSLEIIQSRPHKNRLLVEVKEVEDLDEAEKLRGVHLGISPDEVINPGPGDYYAFQLLGLEVYGIDGEFVGVIKDVTGGGASALLEIENQQLGIIDYPAVDSLIEKVELEEGRMVLDLPGGWRKLARN